VANHIANIREPSKNPRMDAIKNTFNFNKLSPIPTNKTEFNQAHPLLIKKTKGAIKPQNCHPRGESV
jgi:hypothetical protein